MPKKPIIGVTLDDEQEGAYAPFPYYILRKHYFEAIAACGGVAIGLPYDVDAVSRYAKMIDGLLITGGDFDIDPSYYGEKTKHDSVTTKSERTQFEHAITKKALDKKLPILGICGGEQLINVILGGSLVQDIGSDIKGALEHEVKDRLNPAHQVDVKKMTLLRQIVGADEIGVNSSHHQSVKTVGDDVLINSVAPDGVIEGIESTKHPFCLGVQWHPEYMASDSDRAIMQAFVDACSE